MINETQIELIETEVMRTNNVHCDIDCDGMELRTVFVEDEDDSNRYSVTEEMEELVKKVSKILDRDLEIVEEITSFRGTTRGRLSVEIEI